MEYMAYDRKMNAKFYSSIIFHGRQTGPLDEKRVHVTLANGDEVELVTDWSLEVHPEGDGKVAVKMWRVHVLTINGEWPNIDLVNWWTWERGYSEGAWDVPGLEIESAELVS